MTLPRAMAVIGLALLACQPPAAARSATMAENRDGVLARSRQRVILGRGEARVVLDVKGRTLDTARGAIHLVLRGVRASRPPGVLYHLYLDLPAGAKPEADDPRHAATLNFYNARPDTAEGELYQSEDVTELVRALRRRGRLAEGTSVTFVPAGTPEGEAIVSRIELVLQ